MKYSKKRLALSFFAAVFTAFTVASIVHSQFVLAGLTALKVDIPLTTRLAFTVSDWSGLLPGYGTVILISFLLGFSVIGLCRRFFGWDARLSFTLGGAIAFATLLLAMHPLLNITLIAGARTTFGFICQCVAGSIGGYAFGVGVDWSKD